MIKLLKDLFWAPSHMNAEQHQYFLGQMIVINAIEYLQKRRPLDSGIDVLYRAVDDIQDAMKAAGMPERSI